MKHGMIKLFNRLPQGKTVDMLLVYILSIFECFSFEEIRSAPPDMAIFSNFLFFSLEHIEQWVSQC